MSLDRPPCLYYPGIDGTGRLLHRQLDLLATYNVHAVSYPQNRPQTYEELADYGVAHLEKNGPGVVLTESFGGGVALTLALRRPELIRRLVLINSFAWYPDRLFIHLANWLGAFFPDHPSPSSTRGLRGFFLFDHSVPASFRDHWWELTDDVPVRAYGYRLSLIAGLDLRRQLPRITIPALILAAPDDKVVPSRAGIEMARHLPNAYLLRPRVGHTAMMHPSINVAHLLANPAYWPANKFDPIATRRMVP